MADDSTFSRRRFVEATSAATLIRLVGRSGDGGGDGSGGSEKARVAFGQHRGLIPTRTDVATSVFGPYLQRTAEDFAEAEHRPPTLQHGLAVVSEAMTALNDVVSGECSGPYDVEAATDGFVGAVSN